MALSLEYRLTTKLFNNLNIGRAQQHMCENPKTHNKIIV